MKRTLLEILGGLTVLVLLASFHHQISRLRSENKDVESLRTMVRQAVHKLDAGEVEQESNIELLGQMDSKLAGLERRIAEASQHGEETDRLRQELARTRSEADLFKSELKRDFSRTRELVDAVHQEVRAVDRTSKEGLYETRSNLDQISQQLSPNPTELDQQLLAPSVQLNGDDTVGSGTLIFSGINEKTRANETYVITSYHVIRNILADTPAARRRGISVTIYRTDGKIEEWGDMVSHDKDIDAALLKLRTTRRYDAVARAVPRDKTKKIRVWQSIYAVGCPLGNDPIPTRGEISSVNNRLNGSNYWMINAPTYFGNSGGGVYLASTRELTGVFSKIYTHGTGNPVVVPHMGLCTPIDLMYRWLDKDDMAFVFERSGPQPGAEIAMPSSAPPK